MRNLLKLTILTGIMLPLITNSVQAQLDSFGLPDERINAVALFPQTFPLQNYLCAGSDSGGIFVRNLDTTNAVWINRGMVGKKITALHVYHWGAGPGEFNTIFAGVRPNKVQGDSTLLYRYTFQWDSLWIAADSGLDANSINQIDAISGFFFAGHTPAQPIFTAGSLNIFRAIDFPTELEWDSVWTGGIGIINDIQIHREGIIGDSGTVWAGGENAALAPVIMKSVDKGGNWDVFYPNLAGDNACNSIAVDPLHPDTVYAGMEGAVIKTVDGGQNWSITSLQNTSYYFYGLVINPDNPDHLVTGGSTNTFEFGLFETMDGGNNWTAILETDTISGISSMDAQIEGNEFVVYMGTFGDGVYRYKTVVTNIRDKTNFAQNFTLSQNYPNPFNPETTIEFYLPHSAKVRLEIFNVLGQKIRAVIAGRKVAGHHHVKWDGRDETGREVASGVYIYRLKAQDQVFSRKMLLLR